MKTNLALLAIIACLSLARAQDNKPFPLWPEGAPGALGTTDKDIPTLTPFLPEPANATGAAVVICPGGGYGGLALSYEGDHYARFLNEQGIAGFVLKYRLGSAGYRHPIMLQDAARAVRTVRARAGEWKLDKRVGIMGSSAGGHLASTLLTHYDSGNPDASDPIDRQSSRPDLGILCYPVITMGKFTHQGSKNNLLGKDPSEELVRNLSNELQVTRDTSPCFIWHTWEDKAVPVENSLQFAQSLRQAGVPFDFHVYQKGAHGLGLGSHEWDPAKRHPWTTDCAFWLKAQGFSK
jgi:acetyl esterase/lipase